MDYVIFLILSKNAYTKFSEGSFFLGKAGHDRYQQFALGVQRPDVFRFRVYLNKKLLHDIVKYTRYSVLFKYTTTTYSPVFNVVSYLQATFTRFTRQTSDKY